ncbi:serine/threonine-protein kinase PLK4-like [Clupea harengus]|uniref:non-specific serine/threonine protein kinase n=1 Tax=Clupea harengus TaxID=7950 RepID=A0A6P8GPU8_CLUHA|nr:serine/threonine-protein kinase PLK4-like [Clupea harengus]XP_031440771.1 serine/threonine-protein kinase PLK4-like [Clupea harengus]XP_031440773.1 serine/threonine-protein kinase PLK4-like [Clupea harengus]XP_031440774.1 serine/threonine-protein kinase PLK4-like [Clupea harengus]
MGNSHPSVLQQHGFTLVREERGASLVRSQEGNEYLVRQINGNTEDVFIVNEILGKLQHPYIIGHQKSFKDGGTFYVLVDYSNGGDLSQKIQDKRERGEPFTEEEVMDCFVKICLALKHLHTNHIIHRDLRPQSIFFTEFGTVCLGELPEIKERAGVKSDSTGELTNIPPEILKGEEYHDKSDVWSLGCLLYELCMMKSPFTAESTGKLVPTILSGSYAPLPDTFSQSLQQLLRDVLQVDPALRPSAQEISWRPSVIAFLTTQSERTVAELQESLQKLRALADGLENLHFGTTVGSLTGGVIGAAGGITSIVGLILAPFTLGASLIVTGVGVGVAIAGGAAAGVSNITNMVNQSMDRRNVKNIISEIQEKLNSVVVNLQHICEGLEALNLPRSENSSGIGAQSAAKAGVRMGRGLGGISELVRLAQVANLGKVAAQTARAVRVAEVATGIFSAFFLAVDVYFIAMDAKEIHNIRQTRAEMATAEDPGQLKMLEGAGAADADALELREVDSMTELRPGAAEEAKPEVKSETMKFVLQIRETAAQLQDGLDELSDVITFIPKVEAYSL